MMTTIQYPVALASVFLWIGFVGAISFMEAWLKFRAPGVTVPPWLKFRAPGVTVPLGLGIGRLVFNALNKVEWVLAVVILIDLIVAKEGVFSVKNVFYFIPLLILIVQTFWFLPALDARAKLLIQGNGPGTSNLHFYFVGMEIVKVACLLIFGIKLFKT